MAIALNNSLCGVTTQKGAAKVVLAHELLPEDFADGVAFTHIAEVAGASPAVASPRAVASKPKKRT